MARSTEAEEEIWGTWEELILACLVKRHGPHSWESIASEIRSRFPYAHRLTADTCKSRFLLLKNRFAGGDGTDGGDPTDDSKSTVEIPWLDELKNLRVHELRQQVQRHDISIGSLQLKVKKLKEERETGSGSESGRDPKQEKIQKQDSGRSCKESNTTETKVDEKSKDEKKNKEETDQGVNGSRSGSVNADPIRNRNENESSDSVSESKDVKEGSDDVQSTACRKRQNGGRRISTVGKMDEVESQRLIEFLERVRSSKDGLIFDRRLESQESVWYKNMIRRHVDLEMVRNRIGTVGYTSAEFYRDLLLLCNNAIVFYPRNSPEAISAVHLRKLLNKEISTKYRKTPQSSPQLRKENTSPPQAVDTNKSAGPAEKSALSAPLVACRKRSSISVKAAKPAKNVEENEGKEEEKDDTEEDEEDEGALDKKSAKSRGVRTNKARTKIGSGPSGDNGLVVKKPTNMVLKMEATEQEAKGSKAKKRGSPVIFLNRMKNSPPSPLKASENSKGGEGRKKAKEEAKKKDSIATKRNVGRPPKRGAKRAREEKTPPLPKKRGRR